MKAIDDVCRCIFEDQVHGCGTENVSLISKFESENSLLRGCRDGTRSKGFLKVIFKVFVHLSLKKLVVMENDSVEDVDLREKERVPANSTTKDQEVNVFHTRNNRKKNKKWSKRKKDVEELDPREKEANSTTKDEEVNVFLARNNGKKKKKWSKYKNDSVKELDPCEKEANSQEVYVFQAGNSGKKKKKWSKREM
ncbi:hypothetical protein Tco_0992214 [Tanacetum coccineum]|uniref:Uncharacterized protein n=1 Tax=Tanacetum coccineum TaxID=301880 RepID=A0ABQ5F1P7_9ASTR